LPEKSFPPVTERRTPQFSIRYLVFTRKIFSLTSPNGLPRFVAGGRAAAVAAAKCIVLSRLQQLCYPGPPFPSPRGAALRWLLVVRLGCSSPRNFDRQTDSCPRASRTRRNFCHGQLDRTQPPNHREDLPVRFLRKRRRCTQGLFLGRFSGRTARCV
jgi:hypothetical protein